MPDALVLKWTSTITRCLRRVVEETSAKGWEENPTRLDAAALNLQRACQAAMSIAEWRVRGEGLGPLSPQHYGQAFKVLVEADKLSKDLGSRMAVNVLFHGASIHDHSLVHVDMIRGIVSGRLGDFEAFVAWALAG